MIGTQKKRLQAVLFAWNTCASICCQLGGTSQITMWALILEPVPGKRDIYRRIGISNKTVFVSEKEFSSMEYLKLSGRELPEPFALCELKTVEVI